MSNPQSQWDQWLGKANAELRRGSGWWPLQPWPCHLEPPFESFERHAITAWDCWINDWETPWRGRLPALDDEVLDVEQLTIIGVEQFPEDDSTIPKAEQLLTSLSRIGTAVAFEIVGRGAQPIYDHELATEILRARTHGDRTRKFDEAILSWTKPYTVVQFVTHQRDAPQLHRQLVTHYPNSAAVLDPSYRSDTLWLGNDFQSTGHGAMLALERLYCYPLRVFTRLDPDPLSVALSAMDQLEREEWALLQVLFSPARQAWADNLFEAVTNPFNPDDSFLDKQELTQARDKFSRPLFAVSIRLLSSRKDVFSQLVGWAEQFANPPHQRLDLNTSAWEHGRLDPDEREALRLSSVCRTTQRPGILLNLEELASLVHLPSASVVSDRLRRTIARTRPAPEATAEPGGIVLGDNIHRGHRRVARIPPKLRPRHCYVAGASGTGKSTLLLNLILQDIAAGHGVGVLDPHGELVKAVLRRIPAERADDVILFDPADEQFPFALNILEARDEAERERIEAETVMALERYFPSSWGPRLERILIHTIKSVLAAVPGASLMDVERMLTDEAYRSQIVAKLRDRRLLDFWHNQFKHFPKNASDPVLNKLSVFLSSRAVRNIICQRHSAIDFDELLNRGKILLANLSTGLVTERISGMLGSFLVTKIVNAAFRRAAIPEEQRRPWYLYVDEFQAFMNLSVGFERILTEARKYKLVLAGLANQYVGQLSPGVRQAVFGNVGTFVVFRLGLDDAHMVAKEMGVFTAEEILNLDVGQAIARAGGSATAFSIETYREPPPAEIDQTPRIVAASRSRFAAAREKVERDLGEFAGRPDATATQWDGADEPSDPNEDDLVN